MPGVSQLTPAYFETLLAACARFRLIEIAGQVVGYLCAMRRSAIYDGEEFRWFQAYLEDDFLYIDQIAVARASRNVGLGRALYGDLERYATRIGVDTLACEVNHDPINVESLEFHRRLGFDEVDKIETRGLVVSLLVKSGISRGGGDLRKTS